MSILFTKDIEWLVLGIEGKNLSSDTVTVSSFKI
jgi:hypothetical protein